ncbi:acyltransferase family protein [Polymorphobacter fuscus]|uniref:Acyltransferase family protein n=1 Tax=Sandarakinorhabdus fusca TaxID=1439888 RepID=A0A7C9KWN7_9SPHN|nr:acyltransferase [Polymorphobacter fuscus]KAB7648616.1 acyltransferase [Polymorphobacter fuscus]MQT16166.1 acyltransferase family protein [Polymorphobacter fuscus]NJC07553.1 peptidoglycan/LPS O-acetylase OafA/YrhL [Polymorphobacter fuscus]
MTTDDAAMKRDMAPRPVRILGMLTGPGAFRLILAAAVFVSHVSRIGIGRPAVVLFFMLSGYWVTRLYQGWSASTWTFEASRFLRIWPLLAVTAIVVWLVEMAGILPLHGNLLSTLGLLGLAVRQGDVIGVAWSLDLELQFYLLLPFCLWWINRRTDGRATRAALLLAVLTVAGAIGMANGWLTALAFAPAFAGGVAIRLSDWRVSTRTAAISVAVFVGIGVLLWLVPATRMMVIKGDVPWWLDLAYTAWCLTLLPYVAWNVHQPSPPIDREMGNLSFPLYLVHFPLIVLAIRWAGDGLAGKALALVLALVATAILYLFVDRPFERWRSGLWRRRRDTMVAEARDSPP